jgi:hypothetical protein
VIQFARFIPELARRVGGPVTLGCNPLLGELMKSVDGVGEVWSKKEAPVHEVSVLMLDLPLLLGVVGRLAEFAGPYLKADPARVERFRALIRQRSGGRKPSVGLCWSGSPRQPVNFRRSFDPALLSGLVKGRKDAAFFSLQKVPVPGTQTPKGVIDLTEEMKDFADTAAFMSTLDQVITTDTSTAHLAGALGLSATVLLHHPAAHWTWGREGERTEWYPTLRLIRQERAGDWGGVVGRIEV